MLPYIQCVDIQTDIHAYNIHTQTHTDGHCAALTKQTKVHASACMSSKAFFRLHPLFAVFPSSASLFCHDQICVISSHHPVINQSQTTALLCASSLIHTCAHAHLPHVCSSPNMPRCVCLTTITLHGLTPCLSSSAPPPPSSFSSSSSSPTENLFLHPNCEG